MDKATKVPQGNHADKSNKSLSLNRQSKHLGLNTCVLVKDMAISIKAPDELWDKVLEKS